VRQELTVVRMPSQLQYFPLSPHKFTRIFVAPNCDLLRSSIASHSHHNNFDLSRPFTVPWSCFPGDGYLSSRWSLVASMKKLTDVDGLWSIPSPPISGMARSTYELYAQGRTYEGVHEYNRASRHLWEKYVSGMSFKSIVDGYNRSISKA
jgi:hypothetical protein